MTNTTQVRADQITPGMVVLIDYVTHGGLQRAENHYYNGTERVRVVRWEGTGDGTAWLVGQFGHRTGPYPRGHVFSTVSDSRQSQGERCSSCGKVDLPAGMMCRRDGSEGKCLRCCDHNHG